MITHDRMTTQLGVRYDKAAYDVRLFMLKHTHTHIYMHEERDTMQRRYDAP